MINWADIRAGLIKKLLPLAMGEAISKLLSFAVLAVVSRYLGLHALGIFSLGLCLYQYAVMLSDMGTRSIGVRLVATDRYPLRAILREVIRWRSTLLLPALLFTCGYVFLRNPKNLEDWILVVFPISAIAMAFSREWLLWGQEQFWKMSILRAFSGLTLLLIILIGLGLGFANIIWLAVAHVLSIVAFVLLSIKFLHLSKLHQDKKEWGGLEEFRIGEVIILGGAVAVNQLFQQADLLLIGILSDEHELGIYSAATKIVFLLFGIFYLSTQTLYPWLSKQSAMKNMTHDRLIFALSTVFIVGVVFSLITSIFGEWLLKMAWGGEIASASIGVFKIIIWILPFEFVFGFWGSVKTSSGSYSKMLAVIGTAAAVNIAGNFLAIPIYGAEGAAYVSLISYLVAMLLIATAEIYEYRSMRNPRANSKMTMENHVDIHPNFFIIGAPKAGTTSLANYLGEHPNVIMSNPKEPHYFCTDIAQNVSSFSNYVRCFKNRDKSKPIAVGEATPVYLYSKEAVPRVLLHYPAAKFIVLLRNPIDAAQSLHSELLVGMQENIKDFASAWRAQDTRRSGKKIPFLARSPLILFYKDVYSFGEQLERLFKLVPRERVLILFQEEFSSDVSGTYRKVLDFLELPDDGRKSFPIYNQAKEVHSRIGLLIMYYLRRLKIFIGITADLNLQRFLYSRITKNTKRKTLSAEIRNELQNAFVDDLDKLSRLINNDLSIWRQ